MKVNSFLTATRLAATRPQVGDVADVLRADTVLQGKEQALMLETLREGTRNNPITSKRSAAEVQRSQDKLANWGRALQRLMGGQARATGQAAALVVGQASSTTGVSIAIQADRVSGVYTDWSAGPTPQPFANAAARADTVTIRANTVDHVDTAGGADAVAITAGSVGDISTGADADSLTIMAGLVQGVATGEGADAIAIAAGTVVGVDGGAGDDVLSILANVVDGISGGDGNDAMSVDARVGRRDDLIDAQSLNRNPHTPTDVSDRMVLVTGLLAQVDGGAGHDAMALRVEGTMGVSGGSGDDAIALQGGTFGLFYAIGDGNDTVSLAPGTEAVVQITGALGYSVEQGEDSLTLRIGAGSITFAGLSQSGAIGVQLGAGRGVVLLHPGMASLDRAV